MSFAFWMPLSISLERVVLITVPWKIQNVLHIQTLLILEPLNGYLIKSILIQALPKFEWVYTKFEILFRISVHMAAWCKVNYNVHHSLLISL